jgi:hypothetical protein
MLPGGCDVALQTRFGANDTLAHAVVVIQRIWGSAILDRGEPSEIFVYRTKEAMDAWGKHGWTARYAKDMIHLIAQRAGSLLIVLESLEDSILSQILEGIREDIKPGD